MTDRSAPPPTQGGIERGQEVVEETTEQLGYWYLLRHGYENLVNLIIRPPRAQYELEELGPVEFTLADVRFRRSDFVVDVARNNQPMQMQCSQWAPVERSGEALPCVIYLHGNSSCRVEALSILRCVLASGATLVTLDCIGCGQSDGDYISLGYYERDDVHALIEHLRASGTVSSVALWGRSMGAVTALLHADRDPSIAGIIVDSAFANLEQLVMEIVEHGRREGYTIPNMVVKVALKFIRSSVYKRARFELRQLSPIDHVEKSFIPALFVAAHKDVFIQPHHSEMLYEKYAGDKNLIKVNGDHNSARPQYLLDSIGIFLQSVMCIDEAHTLHDPFTGSGVPWHQDALIQRMIQASLAGDDSDDGDDDDTPGANWACAACTFINLPKRRHCAMCGARATEVINVVVDDRVGESRNFVVNASVRSIDRCMSYAAAGWLLGAIGASTSAAVGAEVDRPMTQMTRMLRRVASRALSTVSTSKPTPATAAPKLTADAMGDTTTTRLFGSDWADRRGQAISYTMKVYWSIFGLFLLNGVVTQTTGRDEFHYYDLVKATLSNAIFGKPVATEHEVVAASEVEVAEAAPSVAVEKTPAVSAPVEATPVAAPVEAPVAMPLPASGSVLSSSAPTMGMPMGVIPSLQRVAPTAAPAAAPAAAPFGIVTKAQWQQELDGLRALEAQTRLELRNGSARSVDVILAEIREIEMLKGEIKKQLRQN
ncbi:serine protease family S09X [Achlya hypogyna]|uniref:Serine protease family S09X n=1 Tax=Achlya hypogyna TaxID=1202772 RepID=A0A1V9ZS72_ACHHY|nr:serine protease family S09X [Achlya hypogyna]